MKRLALEALLRLRDRIEYQRERNEVCELGPFALSRRTQIAAGQVNAFKLGRDIERGQGDKMPA